MQSHLIFWGVGYRPDGSALLSKLGVVPICMDRRSPTGQLRMLMLASKELLDELLIGGKTRRSNYSNSKTTLA
jgi:hypothetical protein